MTTSPELARAYSMKLLYDSKGSENIQMTSSRLFDFFWNSPLVVLSGSNYRSKSGIRDIISDSILRRICYMSLRTNQALPLHLLTGSQSDTEMQASTQL